MENYNCKNLGLVRLYIVKVMIFVFEFDKLWSMRNSSLS